MSWRRTSEAEIDILAPHLKLTLAGQPITTPRVFRRAGCKLRRPQVSFFETSAYRSTKSNSCGKVRAAVSDPSTFARRCATASSSVTRRANI